MKNLILVTTILLMGCATKPVSNFHTHNNLHVHLSKKDPKVYALVDSQNRVVAKTSGNSGILNFSIPSNANTSHCFYIEDEKGKSLFEPNPFFGMPLSHYFKEAQLTMRQLSVKLTNYEYQKKDYQQKYNTQVFEK